MASAGVAASPWAYRVWLSLALRNANPGRRQLPCSLAVLGTFIQQASDTLSS